MNSSTDRSHLAPGQHHARFSFDTQFDDDGAVAFSPRRPRKSYSPDEFEVARAQAFAAGEQSVIALAEREAAQALSQIAEATQQALAGLARVAHEHRSGATELALMAARKIAGAALETSPNAPVMAALEALAAELEQEPRLRVRVATGFHERAQAALEQTAVGIGFAGKIIASDDPSLPEAAFVIDWPDGRAAFDPVQTEARVEAAVRAALAADGLHAEPISPAFED